MSLQTPTPESGAGASEHVSTSAGDEISLDDVIAKVKAAANEDTCGQEILAAAITLRDSSGRDRQTALRKMANSWGVTVNEKVEGKYKPRPNSALAEDIQAAVCKAALDWESRAQPSQGSDKRAPSRPDAEAVLTKKEPRVLQSKVQQWQHMPEGLFTSCPKRLMMSWHGAAWGQTCTNAH